MLVGGRRECKIDVLRNVEAHVLVLLHNNNCLLGIIRFVTLGIARSLGLGLDLIAREFQVGDSPGLLSIMNVESLSKFHDCIDRARSLSILLALPVIEL
jgi:hypothetical protein